MMRGETVTVLTGTPVTDPSGTPVLDPYSNEPSVSWDSPGEVSVVDVLCEPRPSSEPVQDARNAVTSGWTLYIQNRPVMPLITPANRVRIRGYDYDVLGEPGDWRLGSFGGVVIQTGKVAG
jgi:hypothetical protein